MTSEGITVKEVLERLRPGSKTLGGSAAAALEKGLADGKHSTPWFVRGLIAVSAWIAAAMFLVFIFGARIVSSPGGTALMGAVVVIAAIILRRTVGKVLFLKQLALALSLAGQVLVIFGIQENLHSPAGALVAVFMSIALIFFYPDKTHRFISTVIAIIGAVDFVYDAHLQYGLQVITVIVAAFAGHLWYYESDLMSGSKGAMIGPVAYGLIAGILFLLTPSMLTAEYHHHLGTAPNWMPATICLSGLLMIFEYRLLVHHGSLGWNKLSSALLLGTAALAAASLNAPGIIAALFVLAIGFERGEQIITGLAIAFLAIFLSAYYYNMEITLLMKSYVLLAAGTILLLLRLLVQINSLRGGGGVRSLSKQG